MTSRRPIALAAVVVAAAQLQPMVRGQQFRASVDAVMVDVSVTSNNRPVAGLTAADFELTDNGVRQTIIDVSGEALPIDVTLIVDTTGTGVLQSSLAAGVNRILKSLRDVDRARIVTFGHRINEVAPLAPARTVPAFALEPRVYHGFQSDVVTTCFDALVLSLVTPSEPGRRQLAMLFTAGRDTASLLDADTVLDVASRTNTAVFVVRGMFDPNPREPAPEGTTPRTIPPDRLLIPVRFFKDLTVSTGGVEQVVEPTYLVRNDTGRQIIRSRLGDDGLEQAFVRMLDAFRSSYVLRYTLQGVPRAGWHELKVRVTKPGRYDVRARKGYGA